MAIQAKNDSRCWICNKNKATGLIVDHCHKTGKVRGALCNKCNLTLGGLGDTMDEIKASICSVIRYIEDAEFLDLNEILVRKDE